MNIKKSVLTFLILIAGMIGFAIAQQERATAPATRSTPVDAAELDKLATEPSFEQVILKMAAEKARQEGKPLTTVELSVPVRVTRSEMQPLCYSICAGSGKNRVCLFNPCFSTL
ncbi:MAG TPA: hypothetical protein VJ875_10625 [Pyrinomonadaceae bacterium]|nr:hypothetical protein [Pyrinomonadaceae bacterium]